MNKTDKTTGIIGKNIISTDGIIGKVKDVLFLSDWDKPVYIQVKLDSDTMRTNVLKKSSATIMQISTLKKLSANLTQEGLKLNISKSDAHKYIETWEDFFLPSISKPMPMPGKTVSKL